MKFKDAAYQILAQAGTTLHYNEITDRALDAGLLDTTGKTPHASMGSLLYTDTTNPDSRFRRGDQKGTFILKSPAPGGLQQQVQKIKDQVRMDLRQHLLKMSPKKFEELLRSLLEEMGFEETKTTAYSNDKGVDVRGVLQMNSLSRVKIAIQAKRWTGNVGSSVVRNLRGSLKVADAEQGLVITPSDFTQEARLEAQDAGKTPISLINGEQLVELLVQYEVGVKKENIEIPWIDEEYWSEILGVTSVPEVVLPVIPARPEKKSGVTVEVIAEVPYLPLPLQGSHKQEIYHAELIDLVGTVRYNGKEYMTPTGAAKMVVTGWKEVNGWVFWRYQDPVTGKWAKIGKLRHT